MDEFLPSLAVPYKLIKEADIFVIIGTSMTIGAGAILCRVAHSYVPKFLIDPREDIQLPVEDFIHIKTTATKGMDILVEELNKLGSLYIKDEKGQLCDECLRSVHFIENVHPSNS